MYLHTKKQQNNFKKISLKSWVNMIGLLVQFGVQYFVTGEFAFLQIHFFKEFIFCDLIHDSGRTRVKLGKGRRSLTKQNKIIKRTLVSQLLILKLNNVLVSGL